MQPATEALYTISCKFCGVSTDSTDPFRQLCDVCLGTTEEPSTLPAPEPVSIIPEPQTCMIGDLTPTNSPQTCLTCGGPFQEYKIGPNWVREPIQCYTCLMKKKYGPDWVPGITKAQRKLIGDRARRLAKAVTADRQPAKQPPVKQKVVPADYPTIALRFEGSDGAMYRRLFGIAHKERRTIDQQVLFLLDGVLGEK